MIEVTTIEYPNDPGSFQTRITWGKNGRVRESLDYSVFVATFKRDNPQVDHTETVYTITRNVFKALNAKDEELVRVEFDGTAKQPFILGGAITSYFVNDRGRYVFRMSFDGQAPHDVYTSPRVSDVDVSHKAIGSVIESISIVDLGGRRIARCYSGRKAILTYEERERENDRN